MSTYLIHLGIDRERTRIELSWDPTVCGESIKCRAATVLRVSHCLMKNGRNIIANGRDGRKCFYCCQRTV